VSSTGHESYTLRPGPIVLSAIVLALLIALAFGAMSWLGGRLETAAERTEPALHGLAQERELPPAPRLQASPTLDVEAHRGSIDARAGAYEWIDAPAGVVRIPLERALDLAVERGLPRFEATTEDER